MGHRQRRQGVDPLWRRRYRPEISQFKATSCEYVEHRRRWKYCDRPQQRTENVLEQIHAWRTLPARHIDALSIDLGHQHGWRHGLSGIVLMMFARRQNHLRFWSIGVGDLLQQVIDAIEACALLINGLHNPPRRLRDVRSLEHHLLGPSVGFPATPRFKIHGT